jgi:hypothetical protein
MRCEYLTACAKALRQEIPQMLTDNSENPKYLHWEKEQGGE